MLFDCNGKLREKHQHLEKQLTHLQHNRSAHMCTIIIKGMFGITSYKLLVVKINGNVGVRASDRPNSPIVVGRDGTNGSTISDASSDRLFDKKNVRLSSSLIGFQKRHSSIPTHRRIPIPRSTVTALPRLRPLDHNWLAAILHLHLT
jgi:hypothetical protein